MVMGLLRRRRGAAQQQTLQDIIAECPNSSGSTGTKLESSIESNIMTDVIPAKKSGWLQKWTNYIKGYRQRWFVLDANGNLSYYRNQHEVGESCRGSINLQEARILSDQVTNNIVISASSQTFHLKAGNDVDRQQWLTALEYARHEAIKRADLEEEEDAAVVAQTVQLLTDGKELVANANHNVYNKLDMLKTTSRLLNKHADDLLTYANEPNVEHKTLAERTNIFKLTVSAVVKAANEFTESSDREAKRLSRVMHNETQQKLRLQEQLEALALQHSNLERAAVRSARTLTSVSDLEEVFHDAEEDFTFNERKSSSSRQGSMCGESTPKDDSYFNAEIVSIPKNADQDSLNTSNTTTTEARGRPRRKSIPERPDMSLNLWSIMKNCIGKELSKIPMPVNFSEPLSMLQRVTEDLEYGYVLEKAVNLDSFTQMCYVAAFAVSSYSTTGNRTTKPFNPLLGETYECDRMDDLGWRSFTEQVSHHPPAVAHHAQGRGWEMFQDFTMTSRFRGKYLSIIPIGCTHVVFPEKGNHYSFKKVTTTVHNIIVGKLWIDNHGEMEITDHQTGNKFVKRPKRVTGLVKDADGVIHYVIQGTWEHHIDILRVTKCSGTGEKAKLETEAPRRIWTVNPTFEGSEKMHNFTKLAVELNEPEAGIAPTDSRLRPDQRLMEDGKWDEANKRKMDIEDKQRSRRKEREKEMEKAIHQGLPYEEYTPLWFTKTQDEITGTLMHKKFRFNGDYWECKKKHDWSRCPELF
ncbi:unnamed protein product, partial [Mesorhabditis belari]|uniref:PH domain-containing protein n=1 Tax=Mesorhabditis belari TaxID=2138241 RepID=A0AAF3J1A7_9BILA